MRVWARRWVLECWEGEAGVRMARIRRWFDARVSPHLGARSVALPRFIDPRALRVACAQTIEVDRAATNWRRAIILDGLAASGRAGSSRNPHGEQRRRHGGRRCAGRPPGGRVHDLTVKRSDPLTFCLTVNLTLNDEMLNLTVRSKRPSTLRQHSIHSHNQ